MPSRFWLLPLGGALIFAGYLFGGAAAEGWTGYAPLSNGTYAQGVGTDLWLIGLTLVGTASILGAVNFITTIFKMRAPGMTLFRMPIFAWTVLVTATLILLATPVLTAGLIALFIDRNYGGHFFDPNAGGNPILWQHLFWFFGHPEVYIVILPAMGVVSEILPVFSRKPLFGYRAFVYATVGIGLLSFSVWAHHMFTTGKVLLPFFAFMTTLIAIPTGVKMFNWMATLWRGSISLTTPMLFALGFVTMFLIGGISGVMLGQPPVDFHLQDTYFVVAHLHYVFFGGSVFGVFAATYFWFPKMTGRRLNESLGKVHFWMHFIGFNLAFFPMHPLGISGMPRRIADYSPDAGWTVYNLISTGRRVPDRGQHAALPDQRGRHLHQRRAGGRRPVGGQHAGVGDHLAAAALQLRQAAADPQRAARLRPAAQARRRAPGRRERCRSLPPADEEGNVAGEPEQGGES